MEAAAEPGFKKSEIIDPGEEVEKAEEVGKNESRVILKSKNRQLFKGKRTESEDCLNKSEEVGEAEEGQPGSDRDSVNSIDMLSKLQVNTRSRFRKEGQERPRQESDIDDKPPNLFVSFAQTI